ncbi:Histidine phosphatase family protein [Rhodovastum atsumiense]|uniref:Histidine phosphatase family protein n=1 Tax=Rhodovastum atsumiense TaxID=504468 RepID=A0A5M6ILV8_9PROT|nr:histidine phosphatase family protein [Rhodovastum atsumiense]KAA5608839.1 histidine phosphatase family protein [Rhodovastum atsumiense]CAH2599336.1 Histidine phosphatase family protein [Rhodovastum atsumiense]
MPVTFHLIRHGETDMVGHALAGRAPGVPLNAHGRRQAGAVAAGLAATRLAAVVSSPRERAVQTAGPLAARQGLTVQVDPGFEELDFGDWTGAAFTSLDGSPDWHAFNVFRSTAPIPGGETALAVQARAVAAVCRWAALHPDADIAIVSHGDVLRAVLAHFLAVPLDLARRFDIAPAHRSVLVLYEADVRVEALNLPPG